MANSLQFQISDITGVLEDKVVTKIELLRIANTIRKEINTTLYDNEPPYTEVKTLVQAYKILNLDNYEVTTV
jgi:hypothetical protein